MLSSAFRRTISSRLEVKTSAGNTLWTVLRIGRLGLAVCLCFSFTYQLLKIHNSACLCRIVRNSTYMSPFHMTDGSLVICRFMPSHFSCPQSSMKSDSFIAFYFAHKTKSCFSLVRRYMGRNYNSFIHAFPGFQATPANLLTVPIYVWACFLTCGVGILADKYGHRGYFNV